MLGNMGGDLNKKIASTVAFICSNEASFITGDIIPINGVSNPLDKQYYLYFVLQDFFHFNFVL